MASIQTGEYIRKVNGTCGHEVWVSIPSHKWGGRIGPKGLARIATAKGRPCYECRQKAAV